MDPELKAALDNVTKHLHDSAQAQADTQVALGSLRDGLRDVRNEFRVRMDRVEKHVGLSASNPPPSAALDDVVARADKTASSASLDVAALQGQMLAVQSELQKQSSAMGIGVRSLKWFTTSEGRAVVLRLAQLAALAYLTFLAATHGTTPAAQPAPAPPQLSAPAGSR